MSGIGKQLSWLHQRPCCTVSILFALWLGCSAQADTIYVNANATGANTGESWPDAYTGLHSALSAANSGDQIWVAAGTYIPGTSRSDTYQLKSGVAILGGFAGTETHVSQRNWQANVTILSGDIDGDDTLDDDNSYHVVTAGSNVELYSPDPYLGNLDGFTITMGAATGTGTNENKGGGMYIDESHPLIRNCTFTLNTATFRGGAVECAYNEQGPTFRNCTFGNNTASGSQGYGGAINANRSITLLNCKFHNNFAGDYAGALNVEYGAGLTESISMEISVVNCEFVSNWTERYGGAISLATAGVFTLTNCLFNNNWTHSAEDSFGGALWTGISLTTHATNCTFVHNRVLSGGHGGAWIDYTTGGHPSTITNCIFYDNQADFARDFGDHGGTNFTISYTAMQQTITGSTNIQLSATTPPLFVDNSQGDPTLNDYRLLCGSPCVNTGSNAAVPNDVHDVNENAVTTNESTPDLDFGLRKVGVVDMGAYERQHTACLGEADGVVNTTLGVNVLDLLEVINQWGACPSPPATCSADIDPIPCPDGVVDVLDLLQVINSWGLICTNGLNGGGGGSISSVQDCMSTASQHYTPYSAEWNAFVNRCVDGLCAAQIIDCD